MQDAGVVSVNEDSEAGDRMLRRIVRPRRGLRLQAACLMLLPLGALSCAGADAYGDPEAVSSSQQAISGGYVDNSTSGVLGLGLRPRDHIFLGHCSGTLIAPNLVLTARHCVMAPSLDGKAEDVTCGSSEFAQTLPAADLVVSSKTVRPTTAQDPSLVAATDILTVPGANDVCGHDVALMILERSLTPEEAVPIVPRIDRKVTSNEVFSSAGYGLTNLDDETSSGTRMRIDENVVLCSEAECLKYVQDVVSQTEWLSANAGVCPGDSGGPALDQDGKVIGVVSRGGGECKATIYGDVAAWSDFIINTALEAAQMGDYDAPFWTSGSSELPAGLKPAAGSAAVAEEPQPMAEPSVDCMGDACGSQPSSNPQTLSAESGCTVASLQSPSGGLRGLGLSGLFLAAALVLRRRQRALSPQPGTPTAG